MLFRAFKSVKRLLFKIIRQVLIAQGFRVGLIASGAIGHLIPEMEMSIIESGNPKKDIWFNTNRIANAEVWNQYSKYIISINNSVLVFLLRRVLIAATREDVRTNANAAVGQHNIGFLDDKAPLLRVPENYDHNEMFQFQREYERRIIALCVRDNLHTEKFYSPLEVSNTSYRNVDINSCLPLIEYFIDQGFTVVRMGRHGIPAQFKMKHFIDYVSLSEKSDSMDLAVFFNCTFAISTGTGLDEFATAFRKRVYQFNCSPFFDVKASKNRPLVSPKTVIDKVTLRPFGISEMAKSNLGTIRKSSEYVNQNLELVPLEKGQLVKFGEHVMEFEKFGKISNVVETLQEAYIFGVKSNYSNVDSPMDNLIPILAPSSKNYL